MPVDLNLGIVLPQSPQCRAYRYAPPYLAFVILNVAVGRILTVQMTYEPRLQRDKPRGYLNWFLCLFQPAHKHLGEQAQEPEPPKFFIQGTWQSSLLTLVLMQAQNFPLTAWEGREVRAQV